MIERAEIWISVLLPAPETPTTASDCPFGNLEIQPLEDLDPMTVLDEGFLEIIDLDHTVSHSPHS